MRNLLMMAAVILLFASLAFGQRTGEGSGGAERDYIQLLTGNGNETVGFDRTALIALANVYLKAIKDGNAKRIYTFTNPGLVKQLDGKEKTIKFIEKQLKEMKETFKLHSVELVNGEVTKQSGEPFNRLKIKVRTTSPMFGENQEIEGFLIPIPVFEKRSLYFLHTEEIPTSFHLLRCGSVVNKTKNTTGGGQDSGRGTGQGVGSGSGIGSGAGAGSESRSESSALNDSISNENTPPKRTKAKLIKKVKPEYPIEARVNNIQGTARLRLIVDEKGSVLSATPVTGLPCGLTQKAIEAAMQSKFTPAALNGKPYKTNIFLEFSFMLPDSYQTFEDFLR